MFHRRFWIPFTRPGRNYFSIKAPCFTQRTSLLLQRLSAGVSRCCSRCSSQDKANREPPNALRPVSERLQSQGYHTYHMRIILSQLVELQKGRTWLDATIGCKSGRRLVALSEIWRPTSPTLMHGRSHPDGVDLRCKRGTVAPLWALQLPGLTDSWSRATYAAVERALSVI